MSDYLYPQTILPLTISLLLLSEAGLTTLKANTQTLTQQPPTIAQTNNRTRADKLLDEAARLFEQGTAESLKQALVKLEQALPLYQAAGDRLNEAITLSNIGLVYENIDQPQKALDYREQALSIFRQLGDRNWEAGILNDIGMIYLNIGQPQKVLEYLQQALSIHREIGDRQGKALTLINIGVVSLDMGQAQKALDYYQQALPISQEVKDSRLEAQVFYNIAEAERTQGNLEQALTHIEASIKIIEDRRTQIAGAELRASYFATVQDQYEFYIDLLMELQQKNPTKGYDAQAFHISERSRTRSLVELLTGLCMPVHQEY